MRERPHQIIQNEAFQFRYCGILILLTLILNFFMHFFIRKQASSTSECQQIKERSTVDEGKRIYISSTLFLRKKKSQQSFDQFIQTLINSKEEELQQITAKKSIPFEDSDNTIIGIHLGRTYSRVGIYRYGKFEIIPNEYGSIRTPTVVAIINDHFLVGEEAKNQAIINPNYTFYDLNRLIGKKYTDPSVHKAIKSFTYSVTKDIKNNILIQVPEYEGESPKNFSPEYIQAKIVSKMKKIAENYLGVEVKNAVITVPSNFNDLQKQATKDIGKIADLNVVQILSESKAAAIAYGLDLKKGEKNVFVIDFGGGTLDITIISIQKNFFTDIAHAGDQHLGGEDFDQNLVKHFLYILKTQYKRDLSDDKNVIQNLKIEAQRVKEALSDQNEVTIAIKDLTPGFNFFHTITRTEFEELNAVLFKTVEGVIITALEESILQKSNIDEVLLVGGSSRIPQVQQIVQEFFKGIKVINNRINNELITVGAAIRGAIMSEQPPYDIYSVANVERTSISYGIELYGGIMSVIIPKNRIFPTSLSEIYTTSYNYQKEVKIVIYQGEQEYTIDNTKIGEFILEGIELAPQGIPLIEVTFKLDLDGILNISAVDLNTRSQENKIIITNNMASSNEEIETQKQNNKKEQERDKFNEQNTLIQRESIIIAGEQFVQQYQLKLQSNKFKQSYSKSRLDNIEGLITTFSQWLQKNKENTKILYKEFKLVLENFQQDIESIIDKKEDL